MKIGILFDLDGTLLDTLEDLKDAVNFTMRHYGFPEHTLDEIRQFVGNGAMRLIQQSLPGREDDPPAEQILATFQQYYKTHAQIKTCPYPAIMEALQQVTGKYPAAIVSNKPDGAVKVLCQQYFPGIFARGESSDCQRKPAPDMLHKAMKQIGVDTCIYVGDSEVDVLTAQNTGVPCLSVLWGFRDRDCLEEAGGKYFCEDPTQIPQMVDRIIEENYG